MIYCYCINTIDDNKGVVQIIEKTWNVFISIIIIVEIILVIIFKGFSLFGIKTYVVTSKSMEPLYKVGSIIYVDKVDFDDLKIGDSVTFYIGSNNIVATHQIYDIDKKTKKVYTQGINNKDHNGNIIHDALPIEYKNIIGKTIFTIPYLGYINNIVTTPPGMYILIVLTIILLGISFIIFKSNKEKEDL